LTRNISYYHQLFYSLVQQHTHACILFILLFQGKLTFGREIPPNISEVSASLQTYILILIMKNSLIILSHMLFTFHRLVLIIDSGLFYLNWSQWSIYRYGS